MIAEYERAQIIERSRRGKRHRAQQGSISVLSGAPYGYRYVKKSDSTAAYYEVIGAEADVVRLAFQTYIEQTASINGITRMLNQRQIPTRKGIARWERSTVWAMLRNPAYAVDEPASARLNFGLGSESRDRYVSVRDMQLETARI